MPGDEKPDFRKRENPADVGRHIEPAPRGRLMLNGGFDGDIFPVNPKRDTTQGLKTYATIGDVLGQVDNIGSIDINPFIALPQGGVAVDALIVRRDS